MAKLAFATQVFGFCEQPWLNRDRNLSGRQDEPVLPRPIEAVAAECARSRTEMKLRAVAGILDFVRPLLAFGRRINLGWETKWDEPKPHENGWAAMILSSFARDGPWMLIKARACPSDRPYLSASVYAV
jgi:hypothetical protein